MRLRKYSHECVLFLLSPPSQLQLISLLPFQLPLISRIFQPLLVSQSPLVSWLHHHI